ncbi:MAG: WD40 repeat domain-containing protein, partial [Candidatus Humimicrobiia bacterium]
ARPKDMLEISNELISIYKDEIGEEYFRKIPEEVKLRADSLNNKALTYLDIGKTKEAEEVWKEAVKVLEEIKGEDASQKEVVSTLQYAKDKLAISKNLLRTFEGHKNDVTSICLSTDNKYALSGSEDNTLKLWQLEWELEDNHPADWDDRALPYIKNFLILHTPYIAVITEDTEPIEEEINLALTCRGKPNYTEEDFKQLLYTLGCAGYGWLREEGVRKKLEEIAKNL